MRWRRSTPGADTGTGDFRRTGRLRGVAHRIRPFTQPGDLARDFAAPALHLQKAVNPSDRGYFQGFFLKRKAAAPSDDQRFITCEREKKPSTPRTRSIKAARFRK